MRTAPLRPLVLGAIGVITAVAVSVRYATSGYHTALPLLLVGAVALIAVALHTGAPAQQRAVPLRQDIIAGACIGLILLPIYCWRLYTTPWQVNTDEVTIMYVMRQLLHTSGTDPLGLSWYFGFPAGIFVVVGWLAERIGGIDLYQVRVIHSLFGVGSALLAYGLFRQFTTPLRAATFALILGANHSLIGISRMAMRDNTGLFLELLALLFLVHGFVRRSSGWLFFGGAAAGLTFYTYFPSRITLVIWGATLGAIWLLRPSRDCFRRVVVAGLVSLAGWAVVAAPVLIASNKHQSEAYGYQRQQFLFYPEGRLLEQQWTGTPTPAAAWKANIRQGLGTFNGKTQDQGYIYPNFGHAFTDRISGVLLWIGVVVAFGALWRRRNDALPEVLALTGFCSLYLAFAFLITKAPNYTRLLVILPFVAWLAGSGLWWLAEWISQRVRRESPARSRLAGTLAVVGVAAILVVNVRIFNEFAARGVAEGNDVGSTGRLVAARRGVTGQTWILAADKRLPYYSWGEQWQWQSWVAFFADSAQKVTVVSPDSLDRVALPSRFTLLLSRSAWAEQEMRLRTMHRVGAVVPVIPSGKLLAVDISALQ
ncbi:MAG: glycosyltransferase family 39 protein [Gemmatimonadales bacterium]